MPVGLLDLIQIDRAHLYDEYIDCCTDEYSDFYMFERNHQWGNPGGSD